MNRGVSQMMEEGPPAGFWSLNDMRPQFTQIMSSSPLLPSSSSSSSSTNASTTSGFPRQYSILPSNSFPSNTWHDSQDLPESWSQLLLGGYIGEEEKGNFPSFLGKLENWDHVGLSNLMNVKHESSETNRYNYGEHCEETQQAATKTTAARSSWSQHILPVSSPSPRSSCITSFNTNILDFSNTSNNNVEGTHHPRTECDSTASGSSFKKARVQASSPQSTFKVRKEKLGDRITVLHQLVSPFGKTDTASVLLEAIGYIRFLHGQIQALSSPYLGNALGNTRHHSVLPQGERSCIFPEDPGQLLDDACIKRRGTCNQKDANEEAKKDLKSRGLCLVPISCTLHVETDINGADYWAPASFDGGLR